ARVGPGADPGDDVVCAPGVRPPPPLAREDADRRPAGRFCAAASGGHHLAASAGHDGAAMLCQEPPDLLRAGFVLAPTADHCDLNHRHRAIVEAWRLERHGAERSSWAEGLPG